MDSYQSAIADQGAADRALPPERARLDIETRPFGLGELLASGWRLYHTNLATILVIALFTYLPARIIAVLAPVRLPVTQGTGVAPLGSLALVLQWVGAAMYLVAFVGIAHATESTVWGRKAGGRECLRYGLSRGVDSIVVAWARGFFLVMAALLLIVPGIIFAGRFAFVFYAVALRKKGGWTAFQYSKSLVRGQWWRVSAICLLIWACGFAINLAPGLLLQGPVQFIVAGAIASVLAALFEVTGVVFFLNSDYLRSPPSAEPAALA